MSVPDDATHSKRNQRQREYRWRKRNNLVLVQVPVDAEDMEFCEAMGFWRDGETAGMGVHRLIRHQRVQMKATNKFNEIEAEKKAKLVLVK